MTDKYNCMFCQNETAYVPLIIKGGNGDNTYHTFEVHYCFECHAEYVHWGPVNAVHLYTVVNHRTYRWSLELDGSAARLWYIDEPGIPGVRQNKGVKLVKNFKGKYPAITPQNIEEKLRFILLFL